MRSLVLLPWVLPGVVAAILWRFMYDPQLGLINSFLITHRPRRPGRRLARRILDRDGRGDRRRGLEGLSLLDAWSISPRCRTSTRSRSRRRPSTAPGRSAGCSTSCIPSMREVIVINLVLTTILTFNYFDMIWVLTRGGPQNATHIFPTKIYELGFGQFRFGEAAAYGVFSILVLAVLIALYFVVQNRGRRRSGAGMSGAVAARAASGSRSRRSLLAALILLPFFWMVSVSLKPGDRALRHSRPALAGEPDARELRHRLPPGVPRLLHELDRSSRCRRWRSPCQLALLAAYTFTRNQTRLILVLMALVIAAQMFPASAIIIPIYKLMKDADLLNTYASLILAYITVTLPVAIWMLRAFMARLPVELDEAAAIDGCGPFRTFFDDRSCRSAGRASSRPPCSC